MSAIRRLSPGPRMSQGVIHDGLLFTAGQVDSQAADVHGQTRNILAKIDALLAEAGTDRSQLINVSIWLADIGAFDEMNQVWEAWINSANPPARATVESKLASPQYLVEIAAIAAIKERK